MMQYDMCNTHVINMSPNSHERKYNCSGKPSKRIPKKFQQSLIFYSYQIFQVELYFTTLNRAGGKDSLTKSTEKTWYNLPLWHQL